MFSSQAGLASFVGLSTRPRVTVSPAVSVLAPDAITSVPLS